MNGKKTVFIGITGIVIAIAVLVLIALLSQMNGGATVINTTPTSAPVSNPDVNIIDLNNSKGGTFDYAVIKADDTIELRNKLNEKFIIGLEKKSWKSLEWSPDGKLLAVLGKSTSTVFDVYIYNVAKKEWGQITDFKNFSSGVDQFNWVDANTILFVQGQTPNRWIHRFNYISKETLKVSNIVGDIVNNSQDLKYIVIKADNAAPEIYNAMGVKVATLDQMKNAETSDAIAFNSISFFNNTEKILGQDIYGDYYKFNLGDTTAVKTTLAKDYTVVCSLSENSFNAYFITSNSLSYGTYSSKDNLFNILGEEAFKLSFTVDNKLSYCANGSVYLKLQFADGTTQWYKEDATKIQADGILDGNKESDIIKK